MYNIPEMTWVPITSTLKLIIKYDDRFKVLSANNPDQVFLWLMGKIIEGREPHAMTQIWLIAG